MISSWFLSCIVYLFENHEIIVYAGFYRHYIKVDGELFDAHDTLYYWTPIQLSCTLDDGTKIAATISLMSRIALKINDRLYAKSP